MWWNSAQSLCFILQDEEHTVKMVTVSIFTSSQLQRTIISSFCYVWFQGRSIQNTVMELRNICNHPYLSQLHAEEVRLNEFNVMSFGNDVLFLNVLKVLKLDYIGMCRQRMFCHLIICRLWCAFVGNLKCLTEYSPSWRLQIIGWETLSVSLI